MWNEVYSIFYIFKELLIEFNKIKLFPISQRYLNIFNETSLNHITKILLIFLIFNQVAFAQFQIKLNGKKCNDFNDWTTSISSELPERPLQRYSAEYKNIIYNLYSNKYFVPAFGVAYSEMSDNKRMRLYNKVRSCQLSIKIVKPHLYLMLGFRKK